MYKKKLAMANASKSSNSTNYRFHVFQALEQLPVAVPSTNGPTNLLDNFKITIQELMHLLVHVPHCEEVNCPIPNCAVVKSIADHLTDCKIKSEGGCNICVQVMTVCYNHSEYCLDVEDKCPMPYCSTIKKKSQTNMEQAKYVVGLDSDRSEPGSSTSTGTALRLDQNMQTQDTVHLDSLAHAISCPNTGEQKCPIPQCELMKNVMNHSKGCAVKARGGCYVCKQYDIACSAHAKRCTDEVGNCCVPSCAALKYKMRQNQIGKQLKAQKKLKLQNLLKRGELLDCKQLAELCFHHNRHCQEGNCKLAPLGK